MLLIRGSPVFLIFRMVLVLLLMTLWIQSSLFLIPELCLLILLPLYRVLSDRLFQFQKCMNYLQGFITLWTMLCLKRLVIQVVFQHIFLILLQHNIIKSELPSSPFSTILRTMYHLVRLAFMVTLSGLWLRLSNNLPLACPSLQPL